MKNIIFKTYFKFKPFFVFSAKLLNTIESHKGEKIDVTIEGFNRVKFDVNILLK